MKVTDFSVTKVDSAEDDREEKTNLAPVLPNSLILSQQVRL